MRVLVTGATGYLGRAVVAALQAAGHDTVAFARHATASGLTGSAYDGDIRDRRALLAAARGCQAICHVAALVSIWHARRSVYDEVNVGGLRNVLETTRVLGIARLVYTSSFLALPPGGSLVRSRPMPTSGPRQKPMRSRVRPSPTALPSCACTPASSTDPER